MSRSKPIKFEHMDYYIELGLNISHYRKRLGMTQLELAEKANMSRSFISVIEAASIIKPISLEMLFCISDALGIKPDALLKFPD